MGAVGDWELCGDRFYSRHELYAMAWGDVRLEYLRQAPWPSSAMFTGAAARRNTPMAACVTNSTSVTLFSEAL